MTDSEEMYEEKARESRKGMDKESTGMEADKEVWVSNRTSNTELSHSKMEQRKG